MGVDLLVAAALAIHALGPIRRPEVVPAPPNPVVAVPSVAPAGLLTTPEAEPGDLVTFHYVVLGTDGREVANSAARGLPFTEKLADAVRGWQASLVGARTGETRTATMPGPPGTSGATVQVRFTVLRVVKRSDSAVLATGNRPVTND